MSRDGQRLADYLAHILDAIDRIERYTADLTSISFKDAQLVQDAVIRNLEIIGEASHNIETRYREFAQEHPELPLAVAYQMRNALAPGYFNVDVDIVWKTIRTDLPSLQVRVKDVLARLRAVDDGELVPT